MPVLWGETEGLALVQLGDRMTSGGTKLPQTRQGGYENSEPPHHGDVWWEVWDSVNWTTVIQTGHGEKLVLHGDSGAVEEFDNISFAVSVLAGFQNLAWQYSKKAVLISPLSFLEQELGPETFWGQFQPELTMRNTWFLFRALLFQGSRRSIGKSRGQDRWGACGECKAGCLF